MAVTAELLDDLLRLPEDERVNLARRLLESLQDASDADELDDDDRQRLHEALRRSDADARAGRTKPVQVLLDELRDRR